MQLKRYKYIDFEQQYITNVLVRLSCIVFLNYWCWFESVGVNSVEVYGQHFEIVTDMVSIIIIGFVVVVFFF